MNKKNRKGNTVTIDLDYWVTQADKARIDGSRDQAVRQRVVRSQQGLTRNPIDTWTIAELGLTLVPRDAK